MAVNISQAPGEPGAGKVRAGNAQDDPAKGFIVVRAADHVAEVCHAEIADNVEMRVLLGVALRQHGNDY